MTYSLKNLNEQQLKRWLEYLPITFLQEPIIKSPKAFSNIPKGFRPNKLKLAQLVSIYTTEIQKYPEGAQAKTIEKFISDNLSKRGITAILDSEIPGNELIINVTHALFDAEYTVPADLVIAIADIEGKDDLIDIATQIHEKIYTKLQSALEKGRNEGREENDKVLEQKNLALLKKIDKIEKELSAITNAHKKESKDLEKTKEALADAQRKAEESEKGICRVKQENHSIIERYNRVQDSIKEKDKRIADLCMQLLEIERLEKDLEIALNDLYNMNKEIALLQSRCFTDDTIREIYIETITEIQESGLTQKEVLEHAKRYIPNDVPIKIAWETLNSHSIKAIDGIIQKFTNDTLCDTDIEILDEIENLISIQYLIIKCTKIMYFKSLEQKVAKSSISDQFNPERHNSSESALN